MKWDTLDQIKVLIAIYWQSDDWLFMYYVLYVQFCSHFCCSLPQGLGADALFEYKWPPHDEHAEYYMLQEQVSVFLDVKSFRRKYPGTYVSRCRSVAKLALWGNFRASAESVLISCDTSVLCRRCQWSTHRSAQGVLKILICITFIFVKHRYKEHQHSVILTVYGRRCFMIKCNSRINSVCLIITLVTFFTPHRAFLQQSCVCSVVY